MASMMGKTPKPAPPTPPAPMPDPMSPAVLEAKRRNTELLMNRAGRSSTILSGGNSGSGSGMDFSSNKLGN